MLLFLQIHQCTVKVDNYVMSHMKKMKAKNKCLKKKMFRLASESSVRDNFGAFLVGARKLPMCSLVVLLSSAKL